MDSSSLTVRYWSAGCSVSDDLWRYRKESTTVTCDARGRALEGTQGTLVWPDYVTASEIDTLVVEGAGLEALQLALWWSDDDSFKPDRSLAPSPSDRARGTPTQVVRFDLSASPEWRGRVRRFQLTWNGAPARDTRILGAWATKRLPPS